jgi:hypothetical protein
MSEQIIPACIVVFGFLAMVLMFWAQDRYWCRIKAQSDEAVKQAHREMWRFAKIAVAKEAPQGIQVSAMIPDGVEGPVPDHTNGEPGSRNRTLEADLRRRLEEVSQELAEGGYSEGDLP